MFKYIAIASALAAAVLAHSDHSHDQEPIAGPHKSLWYNTLPGDGGTQVSGNGETLGKHSLTVEGRFRLFWNQHLRSYRLPPVSGQ